MKKTKQIDEYCIITQEENPSFVDAFSQLQSNIELNSIDKKIKVICVTSAIKHEGKSTLAANLAYVYSIKGTKVLLIDLDLRAPVIHKFFNIEKENGIVDYCTKKISDQELYKEVMPNLTVITSGARTPFPIEILQSKVLEEIIKDENNKYDYIILDVPPILAFTDAIVLGRLVDGYVLVTIQGVSKVSELKDVYKVCRDNNLKVIGATISSIKEKHSDYYYYKKY